MRKEIPYQELVTLLKQAHLKGLDSKQALWFAEQNAQAEFTHLWTLQDEREALDVVYSNREETLK